MFEELIAGKDKPALHSILRVILPTLSPQEKIESNLLLLVIRKKIILWSTVENEVISWFLSNSSCCVPFYWLLLSVLSTNQAVTIGYSSLVLKLLSQLSPLSQNDRTPVYQCLSLLLQQCQQLEQECIIPPVVIRDAIDMKSPCSVHALQFLVISLQSLPNVIILEDEINVFL